MKFLLIALGVYLLLDNAQQQQGGQGSSVTAGATSSTGLPGSTSQAGSNALPYGSPAYGRFDRPDLGPLSERDTIFLDTRLRVYERPTIQARPGIIRAS